MACASYLRSTVSADSFHAVSSATSARAWSRRAFAFANSRSASRFCRIWSSA